jgi:hypothetical protein
MAIDPITIGLISLGALTAGSGIAQGIGQRRAAKASELTSSQQAELARLQRRQREGELGLTAKEEAALRRRFLASQQGVTRELEAMQLTQQAAQQAGGRAVSGRDIFLAEQAEQQTLRGIQQQQQAAILEADRAAAEEERARIQALEAQKLGAEQALRAANTAIVSLGLGGAAQVGGQALQMAHQAKLAEAQVPKLSDADLLNMYPAPTTDRRFGGLV